jgi:hypothetical protein
MSEAGARLTWPGGGGRTGAALCLSAATVHTFSLSRLAVISCPSGSAEDAGHCNRRGRASDVLWLRFLAGGPQVSGAGFGDPVAGLTAQIQGLLAVAQHLTVVAEEGTVPADRVECPGLVGPVTGARQVQGLAGVGECLTDAVQVTQSARQVKVSAALADTMPEVPVIAQRTVQVRAGLIAGVKPEQRVTDITVDMSLSGQVTKPLGCSERGALRGSQVRGDDDEDGSALAEAQEAGTACRVEA